MQTVVQKSPEPSWERSAVQMYITILHPVDFVMEYLCLN